MYVTEGVQEYYLIRKVLFQTILVVFLDNMYIIVPRHLMILQFESILEDFIMSHFIYSIHTIYMYAFNIGIS